MDVLNSRTLSVYLLGLSECGQTCYAVAHLRGTDPQRTLLLVHINRDMRAANNVVIRANRNCSMDMEACVVHKHGCKTCGRAVMIAISRH